MRSYKTRAFGPVGALLWENWRLTYLAFFVALALGAGVTHSLAEMHRMQLENAWADPELPAYAICWFALFMYAAIALYSLADPKALSMRIPSWHYSLPMRTGTMVAVQLVYRVASFSILALALFVLLRVEFGDLVEHGLAWDMSIAVMMFSYVLAVAWSWGAVRPLITGALIGILPLLAIGIAFRANEIRRAPSTVMYKVEYPALTFEATPESRAAAARRPDPVLGERTAVDRSYRPANVTRLAPKSPQIAPMTVILVLVLLAAVHLAAAYVAGIFGRLGTRTARSTEGIVTRLYGSGPRITSSAQQAQFWYEWRRKGWVLPALTLSFTAAYVMFIWIFDQGSMAQIREAMIRAPWIASLFAAFFTGLYMLSVDYRHASSGLSTFLYTRPLSTDAYSRARLRMSVQSVLLCLCLCLALCLAGVLLGFGDARGIALGGGDEVLRGAFFFCIVVAYGLLLWSLLWMSVPVLVYLLWFGCYFYYQSLVNTEFEQISEHVHMFWLIWIPAAVLVAVTAFVWRHPTMWRSLSDVTVARARNLMIVAFAAMMFCLWATDEFDPFRADVFESFSVLLAIIGLSMLPALSILSQPLLLDRLRRR
jgi:hypothetical protein